MQQKQITRKMTWFLNSINSRGLFWRISINSSSSSRRWMGSGHNWKSWDLSGTKMVILWRNWELSVSRRYFLRKIMRNLFLRRKLRLKNWLLSIKSRLNSWKGISKNLKQRGNHFHLKLYKLSRIFSKLKVVLKNTRKITKIWIKN